MRNRICDICGSAMTLDNGERQFFETAIRSDTDRNGIFIAEYFRPVINARTGKVVEFEDCGYSFDMCICCRHAINEAIWKAVTPIMEKRKKKAVISTGKFPEGRLIYADMSESNDHC